MDVKCVSSPLLKPHLPYRLKEWLALDVSDSSANLSDHYVGVTLLSDTVDEALYLVCNMGDYLNCPAQILAVPLLCKDIGKHLSGSQV